MLKRACFLLTVGVAYVFAAGVNWKDQTDVWLNVSTAAKTNTDLSIEMGSIFNYNRIRGYVIWDTIRGESTSHGGGANDSLRLRLISVVGYETVMVDSITTRGKACSLLVNYSGDADPDTVRFGRMILLAHAADSTAGGQNTFKNRMRIKWDLVLKE